MAGEAKWFGKIGRFGQSDLSTQAAVLLPVVAIAGLTGWMMIAGPSKARSQSAPLPPPIIAPAQKVATQNVLTEGGSLLDRAPTPTVQTAPPSQQQATAPAESAPAEAPPVAEAPAVDGLKISAQSWRRGGLGSKALFTFTLRNNNDYAVKDVEITCTFARRDGSHLTDRTRMIPDTINMKSRKTFARMHVGFVNVYASQAKCSPVAANRT